MRQTSMLLPICATAALLGCAVPPLPPQAQAPEVASAHTSKPGWSAQRFMVAAANPLATAAGQQMLQAGGSALDAAIAVQMVLTLVEPQSSGIGGGAFLLHWDGRHVQAWDGRETAPAEADEDLFLLPDGSAVAFQQAVFGGRAVATPGLLRMLEAAHREQGQLPWAQLLQPAIDLAEQGFPVSARLQAQLAADPMLRRDAQAAAYFYRADGTPHPVGHRLRNPALAALLRLIAAQGSAALHQGPAAADLVSRVRSHAVPGRLSKADLAGYTPRLREPICTTWRQQWRVCGFPPPSSGHLAQMQILLTLDRLPGSGAALQQAVPGPDWLHLYFEASRLAFADRARFVADPDFVAAPGGRWDTLLDPAYLARRAALIGPHAMPMAPAGDPGGQNRRHAPMPQQPERGTSHISVVDGEGRALAMTSTIENQFGARLMADGGTGLPGGYLLNNQMTDFALAPRDTQGHPVANRIEAGKRPRSSMSPTLVFDARDGRFLMSLGSPGGPGIIHFSAKTLLGSLAWGLDVQRAIDLPNFATYGGPVLLERGAFPQSTAQALRSRGHRVQEADLTSGLQAIQRRGEGWFGGADPRREGVVMGQ